MLRFKIIILTLLLIAGSVQAQHRVSGKVFDLGSFKPVEFCNVYIVGTTMGAPTDSLGNYSFVVKTPGKYELVFSHIAYRPEIIEIEVANDSLVVDPMPLNIDTRFVDEVVVTGEKDRRWQRNYDRFINYAMGKHYREKNVEIANPYAVDFKASGKGMLTEAQPFNLNMINDYTGYEVNFMVQRVFLSRSNQFVVGYPGFKKLSSEDSLKNAKWAKNRERSYNGSLRHILKSILENRLQSEGFEAELLDNKTKKFTGPAAKILPLNSDNTINLNSTNLNRYVKVFDTDKQTIKKLKFDGLLNVIYLDEKDSFGYPQRTAIEALNGELLVYTNGIPVNPTAVKLYGYLASEGLYEMLPFEYELAK